MLLVLSKTLLTKVFKMLFSRKNDLRSLYLVKTNRLLGLPKYMRLNTLFMFIFSRSDSSLARFDVNLNPEQKFFPLSFESNNVSWNMHSTQVRTSTQRASECAGKSGFLSPRNCEIVNGCRSSEQKTFRALNHTLKSVPAIPTKPRKRERVKEFRPLVLHCIVRTRQKERVFLFPLNLSQESLVPSQPNTTVGSKYSFSIPLASVQPFLQQPSEGVHVAIDQSRMYQESVIYIILGIMN